MLKFVAQARDGVTVQEAADHVGVHRTMATRSLAALGEFDLVRRGSDGRFRIAAGALALGRDYLPTLRSASRSVLEQLAATLKSSACLFVVDGDAAVAIMVIEPDNVPFHLTYKTGSRHPLDRGSAGYAIASLHEPDPNEAAAITAARINGYAASHNEVEPGAWGISVPFDPEIVGVQGCVHTTTFHPDIAEDAGPHVIDAARQIEHILSGD